MKKKLLIFILIILILFFAVIISNVFLWKKVKIEEYRINQTIEEDVNNDDKNEKISINIPGVDINSNRPIFKGIESGIEYDICIDGNRFKFATEKYEEIKSFAFGDIDMDGKPEILVCVLDMFISPSYNQWNVYEYENNNLTFKKKIYNGNMKYNIFTNKLSVTYNFHEAPEGMSETVYYEFD